MSSSRSFDEVRNELNVVQKQLDQFMDLYDGSQALEVESYKEVFMEKYLPLFEEFEEMASSDILAWGPNLTSYKQTSVKFRNIFYS